jgi:hypothetical protein
MEAQVGGIFGMPARQASVGQCGMRATVSEYQGPE